MRRTEQAQGLRLMKFEEVYGRTRSRLLSQAETAEVLGVSERTFRRWRDRYEGLCCKPDVGVSQIRTTTVLSSCFCVGQTVL